jgi:hypothetical protein
MPGICPASLRKPNLVRIEIYNASNAGGIVTDPKHPLFWVGFQNGAAMYYDGATPSFNEVSTG